jgi:hypothetical protein
VQFQTLATILPVTIQQQTVTRRGIPATATNQTPAMQGSIITNKQNTAFKKLENRMDSSNDDLVKGISPKHIIRS